MSTYADTDTDYSEPKSAAELQREIELQRSRVENTIDEIQDRLSPGQMVDEFFSFTRNNGGEVAAGLGRAIAANPLPVALLGISVAWLIAGPLRKNSPETSRRWDDERLARPYDYSDQREFYDEDDIDIIEFEDDEDYPYAPIQGSSLRRSYQGPDEDQGGRFSEFVDEAGKKFRAASDELGNRASHFTDEAGNRYRGFKDEAGNRIQSFKDEAGNLLHEATGWASDTWAKAKRALHDASDAASRSTGGATSSVSNAASSLIGGVSRGAKAASRAGASTARSISKASTRAGRTMSDVSSTVSHHGSRAARSAASTLHEQPMVTGALAFAVGAAIAAILPRTRQEDELLGEQADQVKAEAGRKAGELYQQGKEQVASLYSEATEKAGDLYHQAADRAGEAYNQARSALADQAHVAADRARDVADKVDARADEVRANENKRFQNG